MRDKALATRSSGGEARRIRDPRATKEAILQATLSRLATSGAEGVSLVKIAQIAQVNRSTVYEHFKSREYLIAGRVRGSRTGCIARSSPI
jgi:AcrR family transcriptional regulator